MVKNTMCGLLRLNIRAKHEHNAVHTRTYDQRIEQTGSVGHLDFKYESDILLSNRRVSSAHWTFQRAASCSCRVDQINNK